jgi:hypothetical protein
LTIFQGKLFNNKHSYLSLQKTSSIQLMNYVVFEAHPPA